MLGKTYLLIILLLFAKINFAQDLTKPPDQLFNQLKVDKTNRDKVVTMLQIGDYYIHKPSSTIKKLDTAANYLQLALQLSKQLKNRELEDRSDLLLAKLEIKRGDLKKGEELFKKIIGRFATSEKKGAEANAWYAFAVSMLRTSYFSFNYFSETILLKPVYENKYLIALEKSEKLAILDKNVGLQCKIGLQLGYYYLSKDRLELAKSEANKLIALQGLRKYENGYEPYYLLAKIDIEADDYTRAMANVIKARTKADESGDGIAIGLIHKLLGRIYYSENNWKHSDQNYKAYIHSCEKFNRPMETDFLKYYVVSSLWANRGNMEPLHLLVKFKINSPYYNNYDKYIYYRGVASLYATLESPAKAEQYFATAAKFYDDKSITNIVNTYIELSEANIRAKNYERAAYYVKKAVDTGRGKLTFRNQKEANRMLYYIDSAKGNYLSALSKMRDFYRYRDSLADYRTRMSIGEYAIQYETAKKEKDNLILAGKLNLQMAESANRAQRLQLLANRYKLKEYEAMDRERVLQLMRSRFTLQEAQSANREKDNRLLRSENRLKDNELEQSRSTRNMTLAGFCMLLLTGGLFYNRYRIKQQTNEVINKKNQNLERLVKEKEMLVNEIHHRVKNNLHTVMSLLESQAAYLRDDALSAVQNSQNRIQAMALIHQKLYMNNDSSAIRMDIYLQELVGSLKDSFDRPYIVFCTDFDQVELNVSQAISIGLIVNEAITNSIKHAFDSDKMGTVTVSFKKQPMDSLCLVISDNGKGVPPQMDNAHTNSLGLSLITGLSRDLGAELTMTSAEGTTLIVEFIGETLVELKDLN
ncbi:hypothetical protein EZ428_17985 [Pedobacter frigiditerrae]|uniref:histidine kinase n=1 Tax=Pedobacter frigiditerrae TaxID=2530452 RepID=A0A4R0MNY4_9SPHI|nr:histidine kinase dimerization/phosphoacceptor domain -containing protein [Pedobacter frigiditerrae]TCC88531.1 hypothetical protein EZ428_17985 [Pedobacter frigiditerrae]